MASRVWRCERAPRYSRSDAALPVPEARLPVWLPFIDQAYFQATDLGLPTASSSSSPSSNVSSRSSGSIAGSGSAALGCRALAVE